MKNILQKLRTAVFIIIIALFLFYSCVSLVKTIIPYEKSMVHSIQRATVVVNTNPQIMYKEERYRVLWNTYRNSTYPMVGWDFPTAISEIFQEKFSKLFKFYFIPADSVKSIGPLPEKNPYEIGETVTIRLLNAYSRPIYGTIVAIDDVSCTVKPDARSSQHSKKEKTILLSDIAKLEMFDEVFHDTLDFSVITDKLHADGVLVVKFDEYGIHGHSFFGHKAFIKGTVKLLNLNS